MSRPLRIEFPGALYHVTSRGDRREDIFEDDEDRSAFLSILGQVAQRFNWVCCAYCLMGNHYHLLVRTPDGNLSRGMRQLNGVYTQASNRRHDRAGHLFQGRYKAILVEADAYLLELSRYIVLNPVRAGMVKKPADWRWSSYRASIGLEAPPAWLAADVVLEQFAKRRSLARERYAGFVAEGIDAPSPWSGVRGQLYLGDEGFVRRVQARRPSGEGDVQIPLAQRRPPAPSLVQIASRIHDRDAAIRAAHATGAYSYQSIAAHFGIHFTTVGRIVRTLA
ncbi:MAG TPA: addiction module toxin RelE [Rhodocyclaceae bacterium]|nr:MAG: addiction module toxin RelE [Betaproteobacteria bacterium CG2_30_68_42]PIV72721.1 MAG: addiction module toxin RelE [Rhodocyclales bacterium CG17_big_fil_post_rev_8_21_14_2_50_68_7]PIX74891.1 MAG: addiction module toxin RelE [Rhodocyclales bacterium CG_4_10_14_3_um_filter_68_10]PJA56868.1 MAG: addiction module toxin RelE [Rhodocyclales bacterium CG_4_9_14_3_um_filter_68_10]HCX33555.1 addiction module toxin RelE [Rhodocyclaceae bacterium]